MDELDAIQVAPAVVHDVGGHGDIAATPAAVEIDAATALGVDSALPDTAGDPAVGRRRSHRRVDTFSSGPKHRARAKPRKRNTVPDDDIEAVPAPEGLADSNDWHCSVCGQLVSPMFKATLGQVLPLAGGEPASDTPGEVDSSAADASDLLLSCDGGCMRSFHTSCLALPQDELDRIVAGPADAPWTCADCSSGSHTCTLCGRADAAEYAPILRWGAVDSVSDAAWLLRHSPWLQAAAKSGAAAAARGAASQRRSSDGGVADPSRGSKITVGRTLQCALAALSRDESTGGDVSAGSAADMGAERVHPLMTSAVCSALTAACGSDIVSACLASLDEAPLVADQEAAAAAAAVSETRPSAAALVVPQPPSDRASPVISGAGKRRRQPSGTVDAETVVQAQGLPAALAESIFTQVRVHYVRCRVSEAINGTLCMPPRPSPPPGLRCGAKADTSREPAHCGGPRGSRGYFLGGRCTAQVRRLALRPPLPLGLPAPAGRRGGGGPRRAAPRGCAQAACRVQGASAEGREDGWIKLHVGRVQGEGAPSVTRLDPACTSRDAVRKTNVARMMCERLAPPVFPARVRCTPSRC